MKAVVYLGPGELSYQEVETPQVGPGELLVKTRAALTCGTDVKTFRRGHHLMQPPMLFGHEFAGDVAEVGEGVAGFAEGMRVVAANSAPCNECYFCQHGRHNLCESILFNWGAFAEYVRVPARIVNTNLYEIPSDLRYEEAALLEPLACVVLGNEAASISPGDTVVIAGGGGPIGLMHLQLARHNGARQAVVIDLKDSRLQLAEELGATHTINPACEDPVQGVKDLTEGRGADVVIETAGVPELWQLSLQLVRNGGTVVMFGGCPGGCQVSIDTDRVHYGELTIRGVFHHTPKTVARALQLLSDRVVKADSLITARVPLKDTQKALEKVISGEAIKMAITP
ncbi:MAG TPA: zinc-binding dehydrogenase [Anaerolineae bacterium]|nr:zinc-binding dehydrogenase [Anaerolineae bacterium]